MPVNALGGAVFIGPQQQTRSSGAEVAPIQAAGGVQPAAGDAVRAIEPSGKASGGTIDRRAEDNRRAGTAFEELRRTLAGEDDPVALSAAGQRKSRETSADVFDRAFGAAVATGDAPPAEPATERAQRSPRRFEDLFARPSRRSDASIAQSPPATDQPDAPRPAAGPEAQRVPPEGGIRAAEGADANTEGAAIEGAEQADGADEAEAADGGARSAEGQELTPEELQQVRQLEARDAEVKAHEQAHKSVGGRYAGAISYDYQTGPNGRRYAVGGEVSIDISTVPGDPQATIQKMDTVRRAALAPAEPSGADRAVAATAGQIAAQARVELTEQKAEEAIEAREQAAERAEGAAEAADGAEAGEAATEGPPPPRGVAGAALPEPSPPGTERAAPPGPAQPTEASTIGAGIFVGRARPEPPAAGQETARPAPPPPGPAPEGEARPAPPSAGDAEPRSSAVDGSSIRRASDAGGGIFVSRRDDEAAPAVDRPAPGPAVASLRASAG